MRPQQVNATAGGWLERALVLWARGWERGIWPLCHRTRRLFAHPAARHLLRLLVWTVTLRLPGEIGYWLRARRLRGKSGRPCAGRPIHLARSARPTVSVIIPSFAQAAMTMRCLASIAANPPGVGMEVFVVDDASADPALSRLRRVRGLRLLTTPRNLGFVGACNYAAGFARGEFLMFLNNDTLVRPGWLDRLVETLRERPEAGAAGSKLLFPDGRLQEAGGIIWRDGTGANYGRGDDPGRPVYNYVREADYCSGAALMVRRALFDGLGGFDSLYAPAYFEDADLAFRLRAQGFATLYQPRSEIVHLEGASHGTDPRRGVKAHQVINRERFAARWATVLAAEQMPAGTRYMRARDRAALRPIVLVVEHCAPEPDRDAGSQAVLAAMHSLVRAGAAVKLWVEVIRPGRDYVGGLLAAGIEVLHGGPGAFAEWMQENGADLDLVLLSRPEVAAAHLGAVRCHTGARVALYGHDLHAARLRRQCRITGEAHPGAEAKRLERLERWLWRSVDVALYFSEEEAEAARTLEPAAEVRVVTPYCFTTFAAPRKPPDAPTILFVGGFAHTPNTDAAVWFATEIRPLVQGRVAAARFIIAGSAMPPAIFGLEGEHVVLCPDLSPEDLRTLYEGVRVIVAPLRFGAGVKLKVVEALREGAPLVTTATGAQGLPGLGAVVPVTEEPAAFANAVATLLTDDARWREQSAAQVEFARQHFATEAFDRTLTSALDMRLPVRPAKVARLAPPPAAAEHHGGAASGATIHDFPRAPVASRAPAVAAQ